MTADKPRINPIVPERDDMIGRSPTASSGSSKSGSMAADSRRTGGGSGGSGSGGGAANGAGGGWKALIFVMLLALAGMSWFGYMQFTNHNNLQQRFNALESRLSSTDESVTQSGAALQLKLSKQGDELEKHWSEIKKLWGVTNDINKKKIEKNQKDISFLANKRNTLEAAIAKESKSLYALSANYLAINADMEVINNGLQGQANALDLLQTSIKRIDGDIKNNREAVKSMEAFRRQINQKIYQLEQPTNSGSSSGPN